MRFGKLPRKFDFSPSKSGMKEDLPKGALMPYSRELSDSCCGKMKLPDS
jgi:hypothetical protein